MNLRCAIHGAHPPGLLSQPAGASEGLVPFYRPVNPMNYFLSPRSRRRLQGVHPDLVRIVEQAIRITEVDFCVLEGMRSLERQQELYCRKASLLDGVTRKSRHQTGHAVDLGAIIGGEIRWDWPLYHQLARAMKSAAVHVRTPLEWGGDWRRFPDGPHFQLPRKSYRA